MQSFKVHTGTTVALMNDGINTDQILPSRFLSHIEKKGFGKFLFANWRYIQDVGPRQGEDNPEFALNYPDRQGASILISGDNFAGGSSREHAVWALDDFGFRVVIAGDFNDIFYNNTIKNGLLAIVLPEDARQALSQLAGDVEVTVNLQEQTVSSPDAVYSFDIDPEVKHKLLNGIDDIMETMEFEGKITNYEEDWNRFYDPGAKGMEYKDDDMKSKLEFLGE